MSDEKINIDINQIMKMIPHRYPILLVDKLVDIVKGESAVGLKNITMNEPQFMGHFPGYPVMPGVLIIESMAQTAALVVVDFGWFRGAISGARMETKWLHKSLKNMIIV